MSSNADAAPSDDIGSPYVGLRPFREDQRHLIFGRDRDAQLLRQKLFSSRLTLLYAPSGVGKTSLLAALVIPSLQNDTQDEEGAVVVSFEQWQTADPLAALKQHIAAAAPGSDDRVNEGNLAHALIARQRASSRSLILVLDQFEQLLIRHPDQIDPIGRELGQAVQLAEYCHIVISLREEFLASLHPLRQHIPTLMSSTYRLEHLAGPSARAAITKPAVRFGAEVEALLVDALIEDLRADMRGAAGVMSVPQPGAVELPFLQLVCKTLWARSERRRLTLDLYSTKLGGRSGIIKLYLDDVLAGLTATEREQAAEILHRLAPQSGVKKLYVLDELAMETGLAVPIVSRLVDHFEHHSVLRMRDTGGATGYELHHDAFTAVLRPWIDAQLAAAEGRRRVWRRVKVASAAVVAASLVALFVWPIVQARARVADSVSRARASFNAGQEAAALAEWNDLAGYLIGRNDVDRLLQLLQENKDFVPRQAGMNGIEEALPEALLAEQATETAERPRPSTTDSVVVSFSPERPLNLTGFHYAWRVGAFRLLTRWGLPVPIKIQMKRDPGLDIGRIEIQRENPSTTTEPLFLSVRSRPDHIVLLAEDVPASRTNALDALRRSNASDVQEILPNGARGQGWYVPSWTAPVWSALGIPTWPSEFDIALTLNARVLTEPGLFLDAETVRFLLDRTRTQFCETVSDAVSARGGDERIRSDLIAVLSAGRSIGDLPDLLDALAAFPATEPSGSVAQILVNAGKGSSVPQTVPAVKHIARNRGCTAKEAEPPEVPERFRDLLFPPLQTEVRVALGAELARSFELDRSRRAFRQRTTEIRAAIYSRLGVIPPEVAVPRADPQLPSRQFAILWPGQGRERAPAPMPPSVTTESDALAAALATEMEARVTSFIKAEAVSAALDELPSSLETWLRQTYSLTDLKILLRGVLGPRAVSQGPEPERTLGQLPWLLGSLAFHTTACPARDEACLIAGLLSSQRARIAAKRDGVVGASAGARDEDVSEGIRLLKEGTLPGAAASFRRALGHDRAAAGQEFGRQWAQDVRAIQGYQLRCPAPGQPGASEGPPVSLRAAWEIEDYLERRQPGEVEEQDRVTLGLCLLRAYLANEDTSRSERAWQRLMTESGDGRQWPLAAQFLAGRALFEAVRTEIIDDKHLADSERLLAAAFTNLSEADRSNVFGELLEVCDTSWLAPRCRGHMQAIQEAVAGSFSMPFRLGLSLSAYGHPADAEEALRMFDKAESVFPKKEPSGEQARLRAWVLYGRARASSLLANGAADHAARSRDLFQKLLAATPAKQRDGWPSQEDTYSNLFYLDANVGQLENARGTLDAWRQKVGENPSTRWASAYLTLERGNEAGLSAYAAEVAKESVGQSPDNRLFFPSIAAILTNALDPSREAMVRRYLSSEDIDRDFVRLILYWRLKARGEDESAQALITARWHGLDRTSWPRRLERGEPGVWPEMLIAYYHDPTTRPQIFQWLSNEAEFRESPLGRTRRSYTNFLTEAHFYDALLQATHGDSATRAPRMKEALEQTVAVRDVTVWEYSFARYLLRSVK